MSLFGYCSGGSPLDLQVAVVEDVGVDVALQSCQLGEDKSSEEWVGHHHTGGGGGGRGGLCWSHQQTEDQAGEEDEDGLVK